MISPVYESHKQRGYMAPTNEERFTADA